MTPIKRRIEKLENRTGQDDFILACSMGDVVNVKGVEMTAAEFKRLYPDAKVIQLTWGDEHDKQD